MEYYEYYAANRLLERYCEILGITLDEGFAIFNKNKTVRGVLLLRAGVELNNQDEMLNALLRSTLFRKKDDFGPITEEEIKDVKKYYGIEIGVSQKKDSYFS